MGVLGDWENPYITKSFAYEANMVRALATIIEAGHLDQGAKPVNWCFDCGSALAEAEIEYQDKTSPAIDVLFRAVDRAALFAAFGVTAIEGDAGIPIWTTTPWTLPANQAWRCTRTGIPLLSAHVHGEALVLVLATDLLETAAERIGLQSVEKLGDCAGCSAGTLVIAAPVLSPQCPRHPGAIT